MLDPLVPPGSGLTPLYERLTATLARSWRTLGGIILLTFALPQVVSGLVGLALGFGIGLGALQFTSDDALGAGALAVAGLVALLLQIAVLFINAIGWGAGIWAVTQEAAGQPASIGDALRAGLRRSGPMFGWYLLFWLMVVGGLIACILPGIYLFVAGSLFSFVVIYERGRGGIGRSFGLVNRQFGAALGRVLLLMLTYLVVNLAVSCLLGVVSGGASFAAPVGDSLEVAAGVQVVITLVEAAVAVPLTMVMLVGLLLTYTQLRAREEQISTGHLWAAANQDAARPPGYPAHPVG